MNLYQALMKAADHIEAHPDQFNFKCMMPNCGSPGCAIGWTLTFLGARTDASAWGGSRYWNLQDYDNSGLPDERLFYDALSDLVPHWIKNAELCAKALRLYADQYHADPKPKDRSLPANIVAIFDPKVAA